MAVQSGCETAPARSRIGAIGIALVWGVVAVGLHTGVHWLNLIDVQGFPLGFYMAAQGAPLLLAGLAFWWTRPASFAGSSHAPGLFGQLSAGVAGAGLLMTPAAVFLIAGGTFAGGYDGLALGLGLAGGLALAAAGFAPTIAAGAGSQEDGTSPSRALFTGGLSARHGSRTASFLAWIVGLSLSPLLAAHLILAEGLISAITPGAWPVAISIVLGVLAIAVALLFPISIGFGLLMTAFAALLAGALALATLLVIAGPAASVPIAPLSYGLALEKIGPLERALILDGLADPVDLKQHLRPFASITVLNFFAVLLCAIAAAVALAACAGMSAPRGSVHPRWQRRPIAWAGLLVVMVAVTLPAISGLAKLEIYSDVEAGLSDQGAPGWVGALETAGFMNVCRSGEAAVSTGDLDVSEESAWQIPGGPDSTETELAETASSTPACAGGPKKLAVSDLRFSEPHFAFVAAALAGTDARVLILLGYVGGAVLLMGAIGLLSAGRFVLAGSRTKGSAPVSERLICLAAGFCALGLVAAGPAVAPQDLMLLTLTLLAGGVFPALAVSAIRPGCHGAALWVAALAGLAVTLFYVLGATVLADHAAMAWLPLSDAPAWKVDELTRLGQACQDGQAASCSEAKAMGREVANWWGLSPYTAGVIGIPIGAFLGLLLSVFLPARSTTVMTS